MTYLRTLRTVCFKYLSGFFFSKLLFPKSLFTDIIVEKKTGTKKNFPNRKHSFFLYQLCEGLKVIHKKKLFHGDISPQNILLTDANYVSAQSFQNIDGLHNKVSLKIIDFGNTKEHKQENHEVTTAIGTKPYAAPDIVDFQQPVDQRADIYSHGCILGFMLTGYSPKERNIKDLVSPKIWRILSKCTATYHERFADVSKLQHKILKELNQSDSIAGAFLQNVPGFRSKSIIKMIVASYFYFAFLFGGVCMAIAGVFPACIIMPFLFFISVVSLFDVFHIMEWVQQHCYFLRKHHILAKVIQIIVACIVIFIACMTLGGYL